MAPDRAPALRLGRHDAARQMRISRRRRRLTPGMRQSGETPESRAQEPDRRIGFQHSKQGPRGNHYDALLAPVCHERMSHRAAHAFNLPTHDRVRGSL